MADMTVIEHIKMYFEKKGYDLNIITSEMDSTIFWELRKNMTKISFGLIPKRTLKSYELPIPYEKIYQDLSDQEFYIPVNKNGKERLELYYFPKYEPYEEFCLKVDLMPYEEV